MHTCILILLSVFIYIVANVTGSVLGGGMGTHRGTEFPLHLNFRVVVVVIVREVLATAPRLPVAVLVGVT